MPRLFTGLALPADLVDRLASLRAGLPGARWIPPENYHITLLFAGDLDGLQADDFTMRLDEIELEPFTIQVVGLGQFGAAKPHSLWAGVEASSALSALQHANERAARLAGLPVESRKFAPHITLARMRGLRLAQIAGYLEANASFWSPPFEVREFLLFSSRSGSGGGPYVVEERYPLRR